MVTALNPKHIFPESSHPENANVDVDRQDIRECCSTRNELPEFCHPEKFTVRVDRRYIRECCDLAVDARGQRTFADFYVVWSREPGSGKTRLINEYMDRWNAGKGRVHYYLDKTMDELPVDLAYPVVKFVYLGHIFVKSCPSTMPDRIHSPAQLLFRLARSDSPRTENNRRISHQWPALHFPLFDNPPIRSEMSSITRRGCRIGPRGGGEGCTYVRTVRRGRVDCPLICM
jgi:hypothetical protein